MPFSQHFRAEGVPLLSKGLSSSAGHELFDYASTSKSQELHHSMAHGRGRLGRPRAATKLWDFGTTVNLVGKMLVYRIPKQCRVICTHTCPVVRNLSTNPQNWALIQCLIWTIWTHANVIWVISTCSCKACGRMVEIWGYSSINLGELCNTTGRFD